MRSSTKISKQLKLVLLLCAVVVSLLQQWQATQPTPPSDQDKQPQAAVASPSAQPAVAGATTQEALVTRVVDGDTIVLSTGEKVRYIGIDTPESTTQKECYGAEAAARNKQLVEGKQVRLERDVSETDRYGRLLRYIYLDGELVNEVLVREGYAHARSYPPDVKYQDRFRAAEAEARIIGRGLWGAICSYSQP